MIQKIRVQTTKGPDIKGNSILGDIYHMYHFTPITSVETIKIYRLENVSVKQAKTLAEKMFCEPINQAYSLNKPLVNGKAQVLEIAYKQGVMNPEAGSILKAARDLGVYAKAVDTSWEYAFYGRVTREVIKEIVNKLRLYNPLIESIVEKEPSSLLIKGVAGKTITIAIRKMSDEELLQLSQDKLFLNLEELYVIQAYFQKIHRDPTDCELETLAQTWSEHSGHKTFKAKIVIEDKSLPAGRQEKSPLITRIQKEALRHNKNIVSAFVDNSGVMDFYEGLAICGKGETHNSPSAIEPYGGAMTGSGGVFRDIVATGRGAKAIVSTDIFCLANPNMNPAKLPKGSLPPEYILRRVVAAVRDYGNRVGIPTNNGSFHFHDDFRAKPTVLVGAYGILPKKYAQKGRPKKGDIIMSVGGRVGRDGIHGATFSSGEMTERTISVNAQAVQIGNAIEEKRTFDAILEARNKNLIRVAQDSGGGGLSSAIGEMGENIGVSIQLKNERLKYEGLSPWEIWLSESQERMVLAIPKNKLRAFQKICKKYNVENSVLGVCDGEKKLKVYYGKKRISNLDMEFLHHGLPQRILTATAPVMRRGEEKQPAIPKTQKEWEKIFSKVLSHGNVCSKEPIVRLYDHTVQGTNALQPFSGVHMDGPNDAAVIRPLLNKSYGMIVSHGLNPVLNNIDPYWGSIWAATEAIANYTAVGGNYKNASLINNYIWPFPDAESLWSLDRSVDAVVDIMKTLKIPVISGKDSLSSTYRGSDGTVIKIPPVLCISVFGKIPDVTKTVSSDLKKQGSFLYLVGKMDMDAMGGSIYFDIHHLLGSRVPHVDLSVLPKVLNTIYKAIQSGKILSCHDISEGGILTAIFEMCIGGGVGAVIDIRKIKNYRSDYILFNETAGVFIVEVENKKTAERLFHRVPHIYLGETKIQKELTIENLFTIELERLKKAWKQPMEKLFT